MLHLAGLDGVDAGNQSASIGLFVSVYLDLAFLISMALTYSHHASQAPAKRAKTPHPGSQAQGRFLHRTNQVEWLIEVINYIYAASSGLRCAWMH